MKTNSEHKIANFPPKPNIGALGTPGPAERLPFWQLVYQKLRSAKHGQLPKRQPAGRTLASPYLGKCAARTSPKQHNLVSTGPTWSPKRITRTQEESQTPTRGPDLWSEFFPIIHLSCSRAGHKHVHQGRITGRALGSAGHPKIYPNKKVDVLWTYFHL